MRPQPFAVAAGVLVCLEAVALLALAGWQISALIGGDADSLTSSIALLVLIVLGAVAVAAFGVATWVDRSWGRSGAIVTQLLVVAVALGAATGTFAHPIVGVEIGIPAAIVFVVVVLAARESARRRRELDVASDESPRR